MHQTILAFIDFHAQDHEPAAEHDDPEDEESCEGRDIDETLLYHLNQEAKFLIDSEKEQGFDDRPHKHHRVEETQNRQQVQSELLVLFVGIFEVSRQ